MFVGIRELRSAKGRFALITVTVALVALLVSFLSGLTGGLEHRNIAALDTLGGTSAVVSGTGDPSLDRSALTDEQISAIAEQGPYTSVAFSRSTVGEEPVSVAAVSGDRPEVPSPAPGEVIVSSALAETTGITTGDSVDLWDGTKTVAGVSGDEWYSHQPLMWANGAEWAAQPQAAGQGAATTVISDAPADALEGVAADTTVVAASDLPQTMSAYKAENTTLTTINWMLMAIAALVTGAFFTVWTVQRMPDIATLKALGVSHARRTRPGVRRARHRRGRRTRHHRRRRHSDRLGPSIRPHRRNNRIPGDHAPRPRPGRCGRSHDVHPQRIAVIRARRSPLVTDSNVHRSSKESPFP